MYPRLAQNRPTASAETAVPEGAAEPNADENRRRRAVHLRPIDVGDEGHRIRRGPGHVAFDGDGVFGRANAFRRQDEAGDQRVAAAERQHRDQHGKRPNEAALAEAAPRLGANTALHHSRGEHLLVVPVPIALEPRGRQRGLFRWRNPQSCDRRHTTACGKLRCTCATWSDPVIILPGEALTLVNIERQAHVLRTTAPGVVVKGPPAAPDPGEDDLEGVE